MNRNLTIAAIAGFLAATSAGCFWVTTKSEGKKLRTEVDDLGTRLSKKEENLDDKIKRLQDVLDEATKLLTRNSADLGAEMESLRSSYREMTGLVTEANRYANEVRQEIAALKEFHEAQSEQLEERLAQIEKRLAAVEKAASDPTPESAADLFAVGTAAYDNGEFPKARDMFQKLVTKYPGHTKAASAQYYRGESYYAEKDFDAAIGEYQIVFDKYDDSSLADDAMYRAGEAAVELKRCAEARAYFGLLRKKFPKSPLAKKALDQDTIIKKNLDKKAKCSS